MLTLGRSVAGRYVTVGPIAAPTAGVTESGAFNSTCVGSTIAATNRSSPPCVIACSGTSPCGAPNASTIADDPTAAVLPLNTRGVAPRLARNSGPELGGPATGSQLVIYVVRL